jgi:hypothetical protein
MPGGEHFADLSSVVVTGESAAETNHGNKGQSQEN